ncbi:MULTISPECIES: hypothetical protein [Streptomyces]|uniref:hypothetical protein n=1 Tax=Streptomyces TaxID=1883 RepID=UPI00240D6867|nr:MULTISPECIES: hypothetical protein [Streptomyces]WFB88355.1 hypothetical protein MMU79_36455 [Streptomyces olivaceus]WGK50796.1 hypothetical protein M6G09_37195 [Streptomyces sp. B146]
MTTAIMTRPVPSATVAADRQLGDLLARMAREADSRVPIERRARRTLQEMVPGYERQPVLVLHRPVMGDGWCPLCESYSCDPSNCPPSVAPAPTPVTASGGWQCDRCGGWFGAVPAPQSGARGMVPAPTAWTCDACRNTAA